MCHSVILFTGEGHVWQGACVVGCMYGGGGGGGLDMGMHAGEMATEVGEMHPAGMYSCS